MAKEEGPSGITVNCVAPGVVETDMMAVFSPEDKAALAEETPLCRLGAPEDVAAARRVSRIGRGRFFHGAGIGAQRPGLSSEAFIDVI